MKRLFSESSWNQPPGRLPLEPDVAAAQEASLREFRNQLYLWYCCGATIDAKLVAIICFYFTSCGCRGLEDLAVRPETASKHASEHVRLVLGREFPSPELDSCKTALYDKQSCQRVWEPIPVHLPSKIYAQHFSEEPQPSEAQEPQESIDRFDCAAWWEHPVVQKAEEQGVHWSQVRPTAIYVDGVQFTNNDSFHGLFLRDLRSNFSHLMALIRSSGLIDAHSTYLLSRCL
jgi:hypothetical protein